MTTNPNPTQEVTMNASQTSADLLWSLCVQMQDAETASVWGDLFLLARGVFKTEERAGLDTPELREAWTAVLSVEQPSSPVVGLVTFSDGSSFGNAR